MLDGGDVGGGVSRQNDRKAKTHDSEAVLAGLRALVGMGFAAADAAAALAATGGDADAAAALLLAG